METVRYLSEFKAEAVKQVTLPLKNVSLAKWFNSDKENANDENSKGALHV